MTRALLALALLATAPLAPVPAPAQNNWQTPWRAQWIADPDAGDSEAGVFHFRRDITLADRPARFPVRVSADNRYRLFVNGVEVANGPARGDLLNWRYETVDLAPYLRAGPNRLTAIVWNMGDLRPSAQLSLRTGFLLQAEDPAQAVADTGKDWQVLRNRAYSFAPIAAADSGGYYVAGPGETIDAAAFPWGWDGSLADAPGWRAAKPIGAAIDRGTPPFGVALGWQMVPRTIPPMEQRIVRFAAVRRASGMTAPPAFLKGTGDLVVPAGSTVSLLLDQGMLTMGYPIVSASGGRGAKAMLTYAEALFDAKGEKGNRNDVAGKTIRGLRDQLRFDGGADRTLSPLWLRAYRYVQLDIETGSEPLRLHDIHTVSTAYPFVQRAGFVSDRRDIAPIWDLDWNALRLSAFETFWDTPYYEQLQYIGDTRIESLLSVYLTGDDRLMRNAIDLIAASRTPEGITLSSYPTWRPQRIPHFSLWGVSMVHDHWMLRGDAAFARAQLPMIRSILAWHEGHVDATGMLAPMPWWNFLDWTKDFADGVPPGATNGHATAFTLQFAIVLRQAADLEDAIGRPADAAHDRALADRLVAAAQTGSWDGARGLFTDAPGVAKFSQQTNTLAILAHAVPDAARGTLMTKDSPSDTKTHERGGETATLPPKARRGDGPAEPEALRRASFSGTTCQLMLRMERGAAEPPGPCGISCTNYILRMRTDSEWRRPVAENANTIVATRRPRFIYLLSVAQRRVHAAIQDNVDGKTAARAGVLMALRADGQGTAMKQLGAQLDLGASSLSGLLDRMTRDGLVERRPDPADGRAWNVVLTDSGRRLRAEAVRSAKLLNARLCDGFDDAELAIVARWLEAAGTKFPKE